jgi:hypothetical protein
LAYFLIYIHHEGWNANENKAGGVVADGGHAALAVHVCRIQLDILHNKPDTTSIRQDTESNQLDTFFSCADRNIHMVLWELFAYVHDAGL